MIQVGPLGKIIETVSGMITFRAGLLWLLDERELHVIESWMM
jgi:hypothetical protein